MTNSPKPENKNLSVQGQTLQKDVEEHLRNYFAAHAAGSLPPSGLYYRILPLVEKPLIELTLQATEGNQLKAAYVLGINRNTLRKKITELRINLASN
jgi:two-component system nitrogen regulation response regulator GlnG